EPDVLTPQGMTELLLRDVVRERPAPEVGRALQPGIRDQNRPPVVADDRGIPNRLEPNVHLSPSRSSGGGREMQDGCRSQSLPLMQAIGRRRLCTFASPAASTVASTSSRSLYAGPLSSIGVWRMLRRMPSRCIRASVCF